MIKNLLTYSLITYFLIGLTACKPTGMSTDNDYALPEGLADCKTFQIKDVYGSSMDVLRCPNSTVTTKSGGKYPKTSVVIDGVTYIKEN